MATFPCLPVSSVVPRIERCPDCDREWPARFGSHNCNFSRRHVHNNALIIQPGANLLGAAKLITARLRAETCKSAEYANLGGDPSPYPEALGGIDATIGYLKQYRAEMQRLAGHNHTWNENDFCSTCEADGRA